MRTLLPLLTVAAGVALIVLRNPLATYFAHGQDKEWGKRRNGRARTPQPNALIVVGTGFVLIGVVQFMIR